MRVRRPPFSFRAFCRSLGNGFGAGEASSDLLWNEQMSLWNGLFAAISLTLVSSFLPLFAVEALRADDYQVALLSSLPQITTLLATIIGTVLLRAYAGRLSALRFGACLSPAASSRGLSFFPGCPSGVRRTSSYFSWESWPFPKPSPTSSGRRSSGRSFRRSGGTPFSAPGTAWLRSPRWLPSSSWAPS